MIPPRMPTHNVTMVTTDYTGNITKRLPIKHKTFVYHLYNVFTINDVFQSISLLLNHRRQWTFCRNAIVLL